MFNNIPDESFGCVLNSTGSICAIAADDRKRQLIMAK